MKKKNKVKDEKHDGTTDNKIGMEGTISIIEMLQVNTTLTSLDLCSLEEKLNRVALQLS